MRWEKYLPVHFGYKMASGIFGCWYIYFVNSFNDFSKNWKLVNFQINPKHFWLYLRNQTSLRGRFVLETYGKISSIPSYEECCSTFFTNRVIKQQRCCIFKNLKKHTTLSMQCFEYKWGILSLVSILHYIWI